MNKKYYKKKIMFHEEKYHGQPIMQTDFNEVRWRLKYNVVYRQKRKCYDDNEMRFNPEVSFRTAG